MTTNVANAGKILNKISVKTVCGKIDRKRFYGENAPADGKIPVMRVMGIANGFKTGTSDNGDWIAILGQFAATDLSTGEIARSGQCFLPISATGLVHAALRAEGVQHVEFAFDIVAVLDESSATGYIYETHSLIAPKEDDPVTKMMAALSAIPLPQLAAPKAGGNPEPENKPEDNKEPEAGKKTK